MTQPGTPIEKKPSKFIHFFKSLWNRRLVKLFKWWILASLGLTALSIGLGMYLDSLKVSDFWVNVLAGIPSIFIAFLVGIYILDRYQEDKWSKLRLYTYQRVLTNLDSIALDMINCFIKTPYGKDILERGSLKQSELFDIAIDRMTIVYEQYSEEDRNSFFSDIIPFTNEILKVISEELTPQLLQSECSQEMFYKVSRYNYKWTKYFKNEYSGELPVQIQYDNVFTGFLEDSYELYKYVISQFQKETDEPIENYY